MCSLLLQAAHEAPAMPIKYAVGSLWIHSGNSVHLPNGNSAHQDGSESMCGRFGVDAVSMCRLGVELAVIWG